MANITIGFGRNSSPKLEGDIIYESRDEIMFRPVFLVNSLDETFGVGMYNANGAIGFCPVPELEGMDVNEAVGYFKYQEARDELIRVLL